MDNLNIPEGIKRRLKLDVLADFISLIEFEEDEEYYYIIAEPWNRNYNIIKTRIPKKRKIKSNE